MRRLCALLFTALLPVCAAEATTFTVTNTAASGAGSLNQAILDANGHAGLDTIAFNITGSGVHTITVGDLPLITDPVLIDGYTQPGSSANTLAVGDNAVLLIEIDGSGGAQPVFDFNGPFGAGNSSGSTVRGLVIDHLDVRVGILVGSGFNNGSDNVTITGNFIGTDPTGTVNLGVRNAVEAETSSALTVGGTTPAARNVLSSTDAVIFLNSCTNAVVEGNYIGINAAGSAALPAIIGVHVFGGSGTRIGDSTAGAGNVIGGSANTYVIQIEQTAAGTIIQGNLLGTDATGSIRLSTALDVINAGNGVNTLIGGSTPGAGNVISGAGANGIRAQGSVNLVVQGNKIGTDVTGTKPIPNGNSGVCIPGGNVTGTIGGEAPGEGNIIAFNRFDGVGMSGGQLKIRANSMFSNGVLAIDLATNCAAVELPIPNDDGDSDSGSNNLQNFPLITSVIFGATTTTVGGTLNSTPSTPFDIDVYADPPCTSRTHDFVEGRTYLGSVPATTDGTGNATFNAVLPVAVAAGSHVGATATDPAGNTSEISPRILFTVNPVSGIASGGQPVRLTGMLFAAPATVTVGGVPATNVTVQNSSAIDVTVPALPPGTVNDIVVTVPGHTGTLPFAYVADFLDVPGNGPPIYPFVTKLVANALTAGCGGGGYCPGSLVTRAQMAVFLLRGKNGLCFTPPPATGTVFGDVPANAFAAAYIEALAAAQVTSGCGSGNYCPDTAVTRDQMAVFLLRTLEGPAYVPPACVTPLFGDVPCASPFSRWIDELATRGITAGCGGGDYCPSATVNRGQMAVFLSVTFALQ